MNESFSYGRPNRHGRPNRPPFGGSNRPGYGFVLPFILGAATGSIIRPNYYPSYPNYYPSYPYYPYPYY